MEECFVSPLHCCRVSSFRGLELCRVRHIDLSKKVQIAQWSLCGSRSLPLADSKITSWEGHGIDTKQALTLIKFNDQGLVPTVAQQYDTGEVLMLAWMNAEAIEETLRSGRAVYYSRSRKQLWRKGDTSGQIQKLQGLRFDCDGDSVLLLVDQRGVACHTGRKSCFYRDVRSSTGNVEEIYSVVTSPEELYGKSNSNE